MYLTITTNNKNTGTLFSRLETDKGYEIKTDLNMLSLDNHQLTYEFDWNTLELVEFQEFVMDIVGHIGNLLNLQILEGQVDIHIEWENDEIPQIHTYDLNSTDISNWFTRTYDMGRMLIDWDVFSTEYQEVIKPNE